MSTRIIPALWRATFLVWLTLLLGACGSDHDLPDPAMIAEPDGLPGRIVTRLYNDGSALLAATDNGVYQKMDPYQPWKPIGLQGREVLDIAILGAGHYIASTQQTVVEVVQFELMETTNGNNTNTLWTGIEHNFGGEEGQEAIYGLHYDDDNNALYATGVEALAASYDEGRSWELLNGAWHGFAQRKAIVKRNPATNEIWYGGQNAIEQMELHAYSLDTEGARSYSDLLPNPSVIYGVQFHPENDDYVLVSGEGGIVASNNRGETWTTLLGDVDYRFYFDVARDPSNPNKLYTGGWDKNWDTPQQFIFEVSKDAGVTWEQHHYMDPYLFGGVRSILAVTEEGRTCVYVGLYRGGIIKITVLKP
jgi:hypothetical protein